MRAIILAADVLNGDAPALEPDQEVTVREQPAVDVRTRRHKRNARHMAVCGLPVKQEQLADDMDFDCKACWRVLQGVVG